MNSLTVNSFMIKNVITIYSFQTVVEASKIMDKHKISFLPVLNKYNKVIGILTKHDIITNIISKEKDIYSSVITCMNKNVISCLKSDTLFNVIKIMENNNITKILVLDNNNLYGIITMKDIKKIPSNGIYII